MNATTANPPAGKKMAEMLERGEVVFFPECPFSIPTLDERTFLARQNLSSNLHKNISYDPHKDSLHGFAEASAEQSSRLHDILAAYSVNATAWLSAQLPFYAAQWELDRVSYRPLEEATRKSRLTARNDLLHVDAFPTRPTNGQRILRVFVNVNLSEPRVWVTSESFAKLFAMYGKSVSLPRPGFTLEKVWAFLRDVPRLVAKNRRPRSEYDRYMLRFHDFLKGCEEFQEKCPRKLWSFPPGSCWLAMTDTASHAVLRGRHAIEHSYFIAPASQVLPDESPAAILGRACGFTVLKRAA